MSFMACEIWSVRKNGKIIGLPASVDTPKSKKRKSRRIKLKALVKDLELNDFIPMDDETDAETWGVLQYVGSYTKPNGKEFFLMVAWFKSESRAGLDADDKEVAERFLSSNAIVDRWATTYKDGIFFATDFENDKGANVKAAKAIWPWKQQLYVAQSHNDIPPPPNGPMIVGSVLA